MGRNILVINVDLRETRVALVEGGVIAELQIERASAKSTVGNIVLGSVTRVLPGMQAAFIDVGMERAAFLHVEDLIRPDDFEEYLVGDAREEDGDDEDGEGAKRTSPAARGENASRAADEEAPAGGSDEDGEDDENGKEDAATDAKTTACDDENSDEDDGDEEDEPEETNGDSRDEEADGEPDEDGRENGDESDGDARSEGEGSEDDEAEGAEGKGDAPATGGASKKTSARDSRGRRGRRGRRRRGKSDPEPAPSKKTSNHRRGRGKSSRVSRSVPITEVVKEGDEVIVQISKEPIGTKGARVTSHVSLAGRYVVYLPTIDHIGISKRIGSARERSRLRQTIDSLMPAKGGLIVRTVAEGLTKKKLKSDIGYLIKVWQEVSKKAENAKKKELLYSELDLVLKTARDLFADDIEKIIIDDKEQFQRLQRFMEMFLPERAGDVELYNGDEPVFDAYGIEDEIGRALSRKVPLASGGYLIIDQAEALTAIDVNTGRYVGKGSKDLEETAFKTNMEAVVEIAYQLRFRNIGGLVILDLIDMDKPSNRDKVVRELEKLLAKDKAKTTLQRISELGLLEMTRKRTRESLGRVLHEPCFYCDGTGQIQSRETIAYEILRQIRRERNTLAGYSINVNAHPAIVDLLQGEEKAAVEETERRMMRRIELTPRSEYHIEQFDLQGK